MPRPKGKRLHSGALRYVLRKEGLSMTEAASRCGITLATLSGLAAGHHRASDKVVRSITDGLGLEDDSLLFPGLAGWSHSLDDEPVGV
jgi:transcriptional regulator with XRE-family HTH domain